MVVDNVSIANIINRSVVENVKTANTINHLDVKPANIIYQSTVEIFETENIVLHCLSINKVSKISKLLKSNVEIVNIF